MILIQVRQIHLIGLLLSKSSLPVKEQITDIETASEMLKIFSVVTKELSAYPSLLRPIDEQLYKDWVKVFDFADQILSSLEPSGRLHSYVNQFRSVWVDLGTEFGYLAKLQEHREQNVCMYAGCIRHSVCDVEQLACGECLSAQYCGIWCQQA